MDTTDMLKVDLSQIKPRDALQVGNFVIKQTKQDCLSICKNTETIIEITKDDVMIHGKSINAIWKTLENHYEALKSLMG